MIQSKDIRVTKSDVPSTGDVLVTAQLHLVAECSIHRAALIYGPTAAIINETERQVRLSLLHKLYGEFRSPVERVLMELARATPYDPFTKNPFLEEATRSLSKLRNIDGR